MSTFTALDIATLLFTAKTENSRLYNKLADKMKVFSYTLSQRLQKYGNEDANIANLLEIYMLEGLEDQQTGNYGYGATLLPDDPIDADAGDEAKERYALNLIGDCIFIEERLLVILEKEKLEQQDGNYTVAEKLDDIIFPYGLKMQVYQRKGELEILKREGILNNKLWTPHQNFHFSCARCGNAYKYDENGVYRGFQKSPWEFCQVCNADENFCTIPFERLLYK